MRSCIKNGKYGLYVTVGGKNVSVKTDKSEDEITLEDVIPFLIWTSSNSSILKQLNETYQLERKIWTLCVLKTDKMKKPRFINMKENQ